MILSAAIVGYVIIAALVFALVSDADDWIGSAIIGVFWIVVALLFLASIAKGIVSELLHRLRA